MPVQLYSILRLALFILLTSLNFTPVFAQSEISKEITGYVKNNNLPLKNVNVRVQNTNIHTITDKKGYYTIKARVKESIRFSYSGMEPVEIIVEDVTKTLNINMTNKVNALDEVMVNAKKNTNRLSKEEIEETNIYTAYGVIDEKSRSFGKIKTLKGKDMYVRKGDMIETLRGLIDFPHGTDFDSKGRKRVRVVRNLSINLSNPDAGLAIWDVDGMISEETPLLSTDEIDKISILTSVAATGKYGMRGSGGVIVIRTHKWRGSKEKGKKTEEKKNYNQASVYTTVYSRSSFGVLDTISDDEDILYKKYKTIASTNKNSPSFYLDASEYFKTDKKSDSLYLKVLLDAEEVFKENPEALKAIAYSYQEKGKNQHAIRVYNRLTKLRPSYAQSYRDLANAYVGNKQYKKAWNSYLNYLKTGNSVYSEGIEKTVFSEMSYLYTQKKNLAAIKDTYDIKELNLWNSAKGDLRIVFEWNTSEAEFDIEFVDPKSESFSFEHSLEKNKFLILDEKDIGYSSKEFYVYNLTEGDWYVNINYLGNKNYEPTYLKATVYRNWGKINQTQEVKLFKLQNQNHKMQLLSFNSKMNTSMISLKK